MVINNISWLKTTPVGDCNFQNALKRATEEEIMTVIESIDGNKGTKTKLAALEKELHKRKNQKPKNIVDAAMRELFS